MKHRKTLCLILALCLCVSLLPSSALAETPGAPDPETFARSLKALGLFQGVSDTDFALDRAPTRAEALVMLLRLTGKANAAAHCESAHPFADTAECRWADPYIAYAWDQGLTKGADESHFLPNDPANANMYLTFVLRALGYSDAEGDFSYSDPFTLAGSLGLLPEGVDTASFLRADVALVSYAALSAPCKDSDRTLADSLLNLGAVTAEGLERFWDPEASARGGIRPEVEDRVILALDPDRVSKGIDITGLPVKNYSNVLVIGDTCYEKYSYYEAGPKSAAQRIRQGAEAVAGKARVFAIAAPNSFGVLLSYDDFFRLSGSAATESVAADYMSAQCGEGVYGVNVIDRLRLHNDEYVFFRTDHHWTALGAYYAYTAWAEAAGFDPVPLSRFDAVKHKTMLGWYYSSYGNLLMKANPDYVVAYVPRSDLSVTYVDAGGRWSDDKIVYDVDNYAAFLYGDHQLVTITNSDINDDSACVLVKDSYGNPFAVYLTQHYHTVYVVDYRHYKDMSGYLTFSQFASQKGVDDFIVLLPMSMQGAAASSLAKYCR